MCIPCLNTSSLGFIGLLCGKQSELGLYNRSLSSGYLEFGKTKSGYFFKLSLICNCAGSSLLHTGFFKLFFKQGLLSSFSALGCRPSSWSAQAQLPHDVWNFPRPRIEPVSLALANKFLTTGPPGKSQTRILLK